MMEFNPYPVVAMFCHSGYPVVADFSILSEMDQWSDL